MATAKFDDGLPSNPKIIMAGAAASWLWVCGVLYCRRGLTDGLIPRIVVPTLVVGLKAPFTHAKRLVDVKLWETEGQDFRVHDFLDWNPSKAQVEGYRAHDRERKQSRHRGQPDSNRNPTGIQTESERLPYARATHAGGKSASVSASAGLDLSETEESVRETRDNSGRVVTAEGAWNGSRKRHSGSLIDGRAQRRHQGHAWCAEREGFCIPDFLHAEFIGKLGTASADADLRAWYPAALTLFAGRSVGEDSLQFWRNNFAVWVGTVTSKPTGTLGKGARAVHAFDAAYDAIQARREP
ncbi:MAG: hypothetical protein NUW22_12370 [Acidobacteria bacterium]|nr:hypothetical protein [Acidobacteriota bacterium]